MNVPIMDAVVLANKEIPQQPGLYTLILPILRMASKDAI